MSDEQSWSYFQYPIQSMSNKKSKQINLSMGKNKKSAPVRRQQANKTVSVPAAISIQRTSRPPIISSVKDGIHIRRKEFVGTILNASTTFSTTTLSVSLPGYDLNPATATMFPWLSTIARSYERFRFNKCVLHFVPGNPTTAVGRFYAAVDYDYDDEPVTTNKAQLMGNITSTEMSVWQGGSLVLSPEMMNRDMPYRYISATSRTSTIDNRFSYAGFIMCGYDSADLTLKMDMWVEYDVDLVTPVLDFLPIQNTSDQAIASAAANTMSDVTVAVGTSFAGSPKVAVGKNNPVSVVTPGTVACPVISVPVGGTFYQPKSAYDISPMRGNGTVTITALAQANGKTPAELLTTVGTYFTTSIADSAGKYLGDVMDTGMDRVENRGPYLGSQLSTADKFMQQVTATSIRTILNKYPTARFLVPFLTNSTAAIALGTAVVGLLVNSV